MIGQKTTHEWIRAIRGRNDDLISRLRSIYGNSEELIGERLCALLQTAMRFGETFGERDVSFVRAPGRLNTVGMHADHRGAFINPISLDKEILICFSRTEDDLVEVHNMNPAYGTRRFHLSETCPDAPIRTDAEWLEWTQERTDQRKAAGVNEDWITKLQAPPAYLHTRFPGRKLRGFDGVIGSSLPDMGGLSSSSAVVVATTEIMTHVNDIDLHDGQFVRYAGTAEWYVGTRGGFGDHAAIKCGRLGKITHMKTLPELTIDAYLPFPNGYQIIIFDSGIQANKTGGAGQKFNEKTATYEIGEIYLRNDLETRNPEAIRGIVAARRDLDIEKKFHLGDVVECLEQPEIYRLIQSLPEQVDRRGLLSQLPEEERFLQQQFATHDEPAGGYRIRMVIAYGIAESARGMKLKDVLNRNRVDLYGELMNVSHDGDRVNLDAPRFDPGKDLHLQPGDYNCSIPEIDEMVDIALEAGAEGAQISGAGLGGSMMVLVSTEGVQSIIEAMRNRYYEPQGIDERLTVASPVQGAGVL
ncbi:MAG: hypothetical protein J4F39_02775 [Candidatus Latescibacteria bacterium]|nr:hypothetical protein [Candidatus Latescibacterota bacterium]